MTNLMTHPTFCVPCSVCRLRPAGIPIDTAPYYERMHDALGLGTQTKTMCELCIIDHMLEAIKKINALESFIRARRKDLAKTLEADPKKTAVFRIEDEESFLYFGDPNKLRTGRQQVTNATRAQVARLARKNGFTHVFNDTVYSWGLYSLKDYVAAKWAENHWDGLRALENIHHKRKERCR